MRILALNFNEKGLGTFRRSFYFSRELARARHEVTLMTVSRRSTFHPIVSYKRGWIGESPEPRGSGPWIKLVENPSFGNRLLPGWGSGPLDIWHRVRTIITENYDAVFGFEHHPNVSWPIYLTESRKQFTFLSDWCDWFAGNANHFRGWRMAHQIDNYLEEKIRARASRVSVTSRLLLGRALKIGIPRDKVVQIPEGAATDYIVPHNAELSRQRLTLPLDAHILVAVRNGDMCREVRIFRHVSEQIPDSILLILGTPSTSALDLARRLAIDARIHSTGWVSDEDYPFYLACADICFCPLENNIRDRARWPAKILDYLAAGRTTVTNPVGEVEELFLQSEVGVLAKPSDQEFAAEIVALLRDPERRRYLGESGRRLMIDKWDWRVRGSDICQMLSNGHG